MLARDIAQEDVVTADSDTGAEDLDHVADVIEAQSAGYSPEEK